MKRTHSKKDKYKTDPRNEREEQKYSVDDTPRDHFSDIMDDINKRQTSILPRDYFGDILEEREKRPQIRKDYFNRESIYEGYEAHDQLPRRPAIRPTPQRVQETMRKQPPVPQMRQKPPPVPTENSIANKRDIDDFFNVNPTDLNSIYSSPEVIYNPSGSMSYLNPQDPLLPRQVFSNTPYINSQPSINNPIYTRPLNPFEISIKNATAIKPVKKVIDSLIPSSMEDAINYEKEFTKLPTKKDIDDFFDVAENKAITKDVENINFARKELDNMRSSIDSFFDGADLDRKKFDRGDDPMSSYQKMKESTSSHYDNFSGKVINPRSVVNDDDIGANVNGLNLAALPAGNELLGRVNNTYMDPYYNTNTNNLKADLVAQLNFNNLLLGENSIYARPKDMDLLESGKNSSGYSPSDGGSDDTIDDNTGPGGRPFNSSLNFKTLNKRSLSGKNRNNKNKWVGVGQRSNLQPTLSDVRSAKIPVKIPSMYYKGNQVDLVRRGNQQTDLMSSQYEP